MRRFAAYVILILAAILFASTASCWQVRVRVPDESTKALAERLTSRDSRSPSEPAHILWGRDIYRDACGACHGDGRVRLGIGSTEAHPPSAHSPRDIHQIITWGRPVALPSELAYSGRIYDLQKDHPAFPAQLTEGERWAVAMYVYSGVLDPGSELSGETWLDAWRSRLEDRGDELPVSETYGKFCAACHGVSGYGNGPLAGDLIPPPGNLRDTAWLAGQSDKYIFETIRDGKIGYPGESDEEEAASLSDWQAWTGMPWWGDYLNNDEVAALTRYVRSWGYGLEMPPERPSGTTDGIRIQPDSNPWSRSEIQQLFPDAPTDSE